MRRTLARLLVLLLALLLALLGAAVALSLTAQSAIALQLEEPRYPDAAEWVHG